MTTIVTITAPSASGKSTLEHMLVQTGKFANIISHTTRAPRTGEVNGVSYHFVSKSEFHRMLAQGAFIEHVQFGDNFYAASSAEIERVTGLGKVPVVVVEPEGRLQIHRYAETQGWKVLSYFLDVPLPIRIARLTERFVVELAGSMGRKDGSLTRVIEAHNERMVIACGPEQQWFTDTFRKDARYGYFRNLQWGRSEEGDERMVETIMHDARVTGEVLA